MYMTSTFSLTRVFSEEPVVAVFPYKAHYLPMVIFHTVKL